MMRGLIGTHSLGWMVALAIAGSCHYPAAGDREARVERLREVERNAYRPLRLVEGPATQTFDATDAFPLYPYYLAANPRLGQLAAGISRGGIRHLIAYVVAPAGFGKSPLVSSLRRRLLTSGVLVDVKEALTRLAAPAREASLEVRRGAQTLALGELPAWPQELAREDLLPSAEILFVDALDEVHRSTADRILDALERDLRRAREAGQPRCVFLFGRAEAFGDRLDPTRRADSTEVLYLSPPEWRTTGDVEHLYRSYVAHSGREFQRGELDRFIDLLKRSPYLLYASRNLSTANFLIEKRFGAMDAEAGIRAAVYEQALERDRRTHGRPGDHDAHRELYERFLRAIAGSCASQIETRRESPDFGTFEVPADATVELETGESARVRDVLDRSGFTEYRALGGGRRRYGFTIIWLQRYLVESSP